MWNSRVSPLLRIEHFFRYLFAKYAPTLYDLEFFTLCIQSYIKRRSPKTFDLFRVAGEGLGACVLTAFSSFPSAVVPKANSQEPQDIWIGRLEDGLIYFQRWAKACQKL